MDFDKFIQSLGQKLNLEIEAEGGVCGLDIDGVSVMLHEAGDLVLFMAEIGVPPPEDGLEALYRVALQANWLYGGTAGSTLTINPETGSIWLEKYTWLDRIDPDKSLDMVDRFADVAKTWREFVSEYKADLSSGSDGTEAHETGAFMQEIV